MFQCQSCGECCGPVPVTKRELTSIEKYVGREKNRIVSQLPTTTSLLSCIFLSKEKKCTIYPVRPIMCRLFGRVEGLVCPNNTNIPLKTKETANAEIRKNGEAVGVLGLHYSKDYFFGGNK